MWYIVVLKSQTPFESVLDGEHEQKCSEINWFDESFSCNFVVKCNVAQKYVSDHGMHKMKVECNMS